MFENDEMVGGSNNSGQKLAKSKKSKNHQNLALFKNLVNLTMATNAGATRYLTSKARVDFTCLR